MVIFTDDKCVVKFQGEIILTGAKDPITDLWTLLITPVAIKNEGIHSASQKLQADPILACTPANPQVGKDLSNHKNPQLIDWAAFAHSIKTQANAVNFVHQSLGNPKLSPLMKALRKGFLKGYPNLNKILVTKYLNQSLATAKGHVKQPKKGIPSTILCPKWSADPNSASGCTTNPTDHPTPSRHPTLPRPSVQRNVPSEHHCGCQINCKCVLFWRIC